MHMYIPTYLYKLGMREDALWPEVPDEERANGCCLFTTVTANSV